MTQRGSTVEDYYSTIFDMGFVTSKVWARRQLEDLFDGVDLSGKRMLDIGGGSGIYSFYAACAGAREVICLEPEAAGSMSGVSGTFEDIRSRLPGVNVTLDPRIIQDFPTDGEPFDIIFSHASINHLDEDACTTLLTDEASRESYLSVLKRIHEMAAPGAKIIVVDVTRHNFFALLGMKNPMCPTIEWFKHQSPKTWAGLLGEAGFTNPKVRWEPLYRFGKPGHFLLGNSVAAYFLKSTFRLEMDKA